MDREKVENDLVFDWIKKTDSVINNNVDKTECRGK